MLAPQWLLKLLKIWMSFCFHVVKHIRLDSNSNFRSPVWAKFKLKLSTQTQTFHSNSNFKKLTLEWLDPVCRIQFAEKWSPVCRIFFHKLDSTKWYSTNWLGPVCWIPVCRILELKKNDKTNNIGMMQSIKRASDKSPFHLAPRLCSHLDKRGRTGAKT